MTTPLNSVSEFRIDLHRMLATNEHAIMLAWKNRYAVCRTQPERALVIAYNYDCISKGILTAPLNFKGLQDLLSWVDRPTALVRFYDLIREFGMWKPQLHSVGHADTNHHVQTTLD